MGRVSPAMDTCPLARSIGVLGDWWTLLILRNALLAGDRRFDQFHRHLGIATNILTKRLTALVEAEILERVPSDHPRSSHEYQVTAKGMELWPVLSALLDWSNRWTADEQAPPRRLLHEECGGTVHAAAHCSTCSEPLHSGDIYLEPRGLPAAAPSTSNGARAAARRTATKAKPTSRRSSAGAATTRAERVPTTRKQRGSSGSA